MFGMVSDQVRLFEAPGMLTDSASSVVDGLVWRTRTTVITGISKTQLALQLAHAVASGRPFLELPVPCPMPVLYIGQRLRPDDLAYRLRNLTLYSGPPKAALHHVSSKGDFIGDKEVRGLMDEHRPGLLVLDSLFLNVEIKALVRHFDCAVVLVHPCELTADAIAVVAEDEEDSSDYPTFALLIRRAGLAQSLKIRRLGAIFKRVS
jgi:RecA-family ATPase